MFPVSLIPSRLSLIIRMTISCSGQSQSNWNTQLILLTDSIGIVVIFIQFYFKLLRTISIKSRWKIYMEWTSNVTAKCNWESIRYIIRAGLCCNYSHWGSESVSRVSSVAVPPLPLPPRVWPESALVSHYVRQLESLHYQRARLTIYWRLTPTSPQSLVIVVLLQYFQLLYCC